MICKDLRGTNRYLHQFFDAGGPNADTPEGRPVPGGYENFLFVALMRTCGG